MFAGCAGLPRDVQRPPSQAIAASADTDLGRIALASAPDRTRSGFRLLSWSAQSLAARIELIRRAQVSLDVQYYVIHDDETGRHVLRALRDAAERGVRVRLLVDDLYTAGTDPLLLGLAAYPNVEVRLFNPFPMGRDSLSARLTLSLFDLGRVNHRMHNKLLVADGAMAVAGGRNIGNEYFMVSGLANYIDLDAFAVGPIVVKLAALFDQYWNSDTVFPVRSIAVPEGTDAEQRARFEALTDPARGAPPAPAPRYAKDISDQRNVEEELAEGRLDLQWAEAEAFADSPEKVLGQARRCADRPARAEDGAPRPDARAAAVATRGAGEFAVLGAQPRSDRRHPRRAAVGPADHDRSPIRLPPPTSRWCMPATSATATRCSTSACSCTRWCRAR